ncbi:MAG TPA: cyclic-di-AMP-binding protein CbpB [Bacillales bacterium]|nr:cyclic-di-AMP-binding protein CbpB [Bacillales bacterium]
MKKIQANDVYGSIQEWVVPAEKVANVQIGNPLDHALLVLIKTGYSAIPVLDSSSCLKGLISKTMILDFALGLERIEFDKLTNHQVEEVMRKDVPTVRENEAFLRALKLSIDSPFLCVINDSGYFQGILPRSAVLKFVNHYLREMQKELAEHK